MDYSRLSLADVCRALLDEGRQTQSMCGGLQPHQLNWKPDEQRWSIGQCFQHLVTANELMERAAIHALSHPRMSVLQRVPLLPALLGRMLVRSQSPGGTRRYTAPAPLRPTRGAMPDDVIAQFVEQ